MGSFVGKTILVTGAAGYLGGALIQRLADCNCRLIACSRKKIKSKEGVEWLQLDLSDYKKTIKAISHIKPDIIFHSAGYPHGYQQLDMVYPTFVNNAKATVNLLTATKEQGCEKFVYFGSMEEPFIESGYAIPSSPYAASKQIGTSYTLMFHRLFQLPTVVLKIYLVYGPGNQDKRKLIPYTITSMLAERIPRLSSGTRKLDIVYIDDVIEAALLAAENNDVVGKGIDIGSGRLVSIRELVENIRSLIDNGIEPIFGAEEERIFEISPTAEIEKTESILGWKPQTELMNGLKKTINYYRQQL